MKNQVGVYKDIYNEASEYLLSFEGINKPMIDRQINHWKNRKSKTIEDLTLAMLGSISNKGGMPNSIGDIEKLRPFLYDFNPKGILDNYGNDWKKLFTTIQSNYKPPGRMLIDNPRSYWVIFCKAILSASDFLSDFQNLKEFDKFVSRFYLNEYTRVALPLLLQKEVFGLGFALACDFLKENGYPKFVKPDVHIIEIFHGIGISKSKSDYEVFKDVVRFSDEIDELPYCVDKLFWLVGSGYFYLYDVRIRTNRNEFVEKMRHKYR